MVSGVAEAQESIRQAEESNPIKWKVWDTTGWGKLDFIANGLHTEESFEEKVYETTLHMILAGARKTEGGEWQVDNGHSVWSYHPWCWRQPTRGYNKKCLDRLRVTTPFLVQD